MEDWKAPVLFEAIGSYEASLPPGAWPNWVLGNHDKPRFAGRNGPAQARVGAMLLLTLRGTSTIYYSDEIGMQNAAIPQDRVRDNSDQHRDPQRTPMQWSAGPNAGFTTGRPWLDVDESYATINVEARQHDPASILSLYKHLLDVRRSEPALYGGDYLPVGIQESVISFIRADPSTGKRFLVLLNLGHNAELFKLPAHFDFKSRILFNTDLKRRGELVQLQIRVAGDEGILAEVID